MRLRCILISLVVVSLVAPGQATATHVACGDTLTQDTTLDSDLVGCPARGLVMGADGVDLDLAGHTISGTPTSFFGIEARGVRELTIRNGSITGFSSFGLLMSDVSDSRVTEVTVSAHFVGIYVVGDSDRNRIERNSVTANSGLELQDDSDANVVARNSIVAGIDGINLDYDFRHRMQFNRVERNHVTAVSEGLFVNGNDD